MNTNDIQIALPASKSLSNRWLIVNHIFGGAFVLTNLSNSDDTCLMRRLLRQMQEDKSSVYDCANAGTVARFMVALLAVGSGVSVLTGDERLCQRPMGDMVKALNSIGLSVSYLNKEGFPPVQIDGRKPIRKMVTVRASQSSQFASAIMLMGLFLPTGITVNMVGRIASRPYLEMTAHVIRSAGVSVTLSPNGHVYSVGSKPKAAQRQVVAIENDWTAASYFYIMAVLMPGIRIRLRGLSLDSCQGDKVIDEMFRHLGVESRQVKSPYRANNRTLTIVASGATESKVSFGFVDCPDLLPSVAVACAALGVDARLRQVNNLRIKESDRIEAVSAELRKMGCRIAVSNNVMHLYPSQLHAVDQIDTHGDHRIAMAFAALTLRFPEMKIAHPEVVSKSFPDFWAQFDQVRNWLAKHQKK